MTIDEYVRLTATDLLQRLAGGEVTAAELADCALSRIEAVNGRINAFCQID